MDHPDKPGDDGRESDRLTHAKNFANELNESRLWKIKISYQKRWTHHRRAQKRVEIQITKPWNRSTGPKTHAGKARTRLNALRHDPADQAIKHALRLHQLFLRSIHTLISMRKGHHPDVEAQQARCSRLGIAANHILMSALLLSGHTKLFPPCKRGPSRPPFTRGKQIDMVAA